MTLSQESYVDNLVRLHGLDPQSTAGLPCPKEWLQDEDFDDSIENFSDDELRRAQRVTGECLWLAYRTRPDILFVTNYMAAMTSKKPVKVYHVGLKVIAYLKLDSSAEAEDCRNSRTVGSRTNAVSTAEQSEAEQTPVHSRTVGSRTDAVHSRTVGGI